uniref:Uncharacterized protein n=1 Tax=Aplanochytrium stocchinoi TaxID=215587 RepID=A0A7S3PE58_9STRA|mmetsp:Transcript_18461/g.22682  ORF Transcript_18461/g.22682 Transcript_18461/m.22682 type:complete len:318 (+) Transcript_18461:1841-2794(+)
MVGSSSDREYDGVSTEINYLKPSVKGKKRLLYDQKTRSSVTKSYPVQLHNARLFPEKSHIENIKDHGFTLVKEFLPIADVLKIINPPEYRDDKDIPEPEESIAERDAYFQQVAEKVRNITGADFAYVITWAVRNQNKIHAKNSDKKKSAQYLVQYASFAHTDFTTDILPRAMKFFLKRGVSQDVAKRLKVSFFGTWQPTGNPVEMFPLALCDAGSAEPGDLVKCTLGYAITPSGDKRYQPPIGIPTYNPSHKWYFYPRMQPDELIMFTHCDGRDGWPKQTYHTAVKHDIKPNPRTRTSIETRVICGFLDKEVEASKL